MFTLTAKIENCFFTPPSERYPDASYKVQLIGDQITKDGQVRKELLTLNFPVEAYRVLEQKIGKVVSMPIGLFVNDGRMQPFFPKGRASEIISEAK